MTTSTQTEGYPTLIRDLEAEHQALRQIVECLRTEQWDRLTPADGWAIRDQVQHLARFDELGALAITQPGRFAEERDTIAASVDRFLADEITRAAATPPLELEGWWLSAAASLVEALSGVEETARLPWFGPPMSARSFASARLMEAWAHGEDIARTLGVDRPATDRLRHVAHLGVLTRRWSYINRGLTPPDCEIRVELAAPSGDRWTWGPEAAAQRISGTAVGFALVVTQRASVAQAALHIVGDDAHEWMDLAQCFAGPPTRRG
jgi:uncharacterized protein (TIGR03084 family)